MKRDRDYYFRKLVVSNRGSVRDKRRARRAFRYMALIEINQRLKAWAKRLSRNG